MKTVTVLETGNIASVAAAFRRLDAEVLISRDPEEILSASHLVLPGVGSFAAGMRLIEGFKLGAPIRERISADKPTLGVCLGMQLLFESSEESPGTKGLGVFPGQIVQLRTTLPRPHLSWGEVTSVAGFADAKNGWAYFAHSFALEAAPVDCEVLLCDYGCSFVAALRRNKLLACQFHPELSGKFGSDLLLRWLS